MIDATKWTAVKWSIDWNLNGMAGCSWRTFDVVKTAHPVCSLDASLKTAGSP
jgi:hypothetical protein